MSCSLTCPFRYLENNYTRTCEPCPYDCYTCDRNRECISCNETHDFRSLSNATLRCTPITGYYDIKVQIALPCNPGCVECRSLSLCFRCMSGLYMYNDQYCLSSCPDQYFPNDRYRICQPCPYDCQTCNSNGACLSCNASDNRIYSN